MKYLLIPFLLALSQVASSEAKLTFTSECTLSVVTEGYVQHVNLKNIAKVMASTDGYSISLDGFNLLNLSSDQSKRITTRFIKCSD
jgi:hypothetical protein